jgi:acetylglutamate kinase
MASRKKKGCCDESRLAVKIVIKIGGVALEDEATLHKCARAVVEMAKDGHRVAVVHGGGTALTRTLKLLGKQSDFINGLRITDAETRDVALMVLAGMVNKKVVAAIVRAGLPAVGFCGGDGMTFRARKKQTQGYDLGFVGEICSVEPRWFEAIWSEGGIPVLSSLALGSDGEYYNVNADQMASACAIACKADTLIFLTDVPGVKDADGVVMPWLTTKQVPALIAGSVVGGGMLPKLEACRNALKRGVGRVRILPAAQAEILPQFYFQKLEYGTEVIGA